MTGYLPENFDWTVEDIENARALIGRRVYVDLGDSIIDGGEFTGMVDNATDLGMTIGGEFYPYHRLTHVAVDA